MKNMKIAVLIALGFALLMGAKAYAQPPMPDSVRVERHLQFLKDSLNLSDSQTVQIRAILENEQKEAAADREKYKGNRDEMMKAREDRREATDKKIMAVLNKDQQEKYEKVRSEFPRGPRGKGRGAGK